MPVPRAIASRHAADLVILLLIINKLQAWSWARIGEPDMNASIASLDLVPMVASCHPGNASPP